MLYSPIFGQYIVRVHWRVLQKLLGLFHKAEKASELKAYSEVFKTAEINSTLYAYPSKGTVMGWLKYANVRLVISPEIPIFWNLFENIEQLVLKPSFKSSQSLRKNRGMKYEPTK